MVSYLSHLTVDAHDACAQSRWWAEVLGFAEDPSDPNEPGHVGRLHAVLDDCTPSAILTTTEAAEGVRKFFRTRPARK